MHLGFGGGLLGQREGCALLLKQLFRFFVELVVRHHSDQAQVTLHDMAEFGDDRPHELAAFLPIPAGGVEHYRPAVERGHRVTAG